MTKLEQFTLIIDIAFGRISRCQHHGPKFHKIRKFKAKPKVRKEPEARHGDAAELSPASKAWLAQKLREKSFDLTDEL